MKIAGLTEYEKCLLELIWDCKTVQELQDFQLLLDPDDLRLSNSLIRLLELEYIDEYQAQVNDLTMAQTVIQEILDK